MSASAELWPFEGRAAIFDFDGTLADTAYIWHEVDRTFLERRGLPVPTDYGAKVAALGFAKGAQYTIDRFGLNETVEDICDEWNDLGHDLYRREVTLREGAEQYLRSLSELGIPCALATTNDVHVVSSMRHFDPDELFPDTVKDSDQIRTGFLIHGCRLPEAYILFSDLHAAAGRDLHPIVLLLTQIYAFSFWLLIYRVTCSLLRSLTVTAQ